MRYAHITGWGKHVPGRPVSNDEIAMLVPTSDEWIRERTGISSRHIADADEHTSTLAVKAGRRALEVAGLNPHRLELVICATSTPDHLMPNTASLIQTALGASNAGAFDLNAACSGFVYAMSVGASMVRSGAVENVLVIGAETMSRVMNWGDRGTCVLFGDGAGAVVLEASDTPGGVLASSLGSDGSGGDVLKVGLGTRSPIGARVPVNGDAREAKGAGEDISPYMVMAGSEVFRFATRIVNQVTREVLDKAGLAIDDVDLILPHQANWRILQAAAKKLKFPIEDIYCNLDRYGNTSAASVPLALVDAIEDGRVHQGDHVVMVGFGGGLTWGACLVEWSYDPEDREWSLWRRGLQGAHFGLAGVKEFTHRVERQLRFFQIRMRRRARRHRRDGYADRPSERRGRGGGTRD